MTTEHDEMALVPRETAAVVLWGTDDPRGMTRRMAQVADSMAEAVRERGMVNEISGREYVRAEGWSLVGAMVGVFPRPRSVEEIREDGFLVGFRATIDLVTRDGGVVGGAVALCTRDEERWRDRDWNQIASMAQTRATAKAYRQTLGFIMPMAGYEATPAEEMDGVTPAPKRVAAKVNPETMIERCPHGQRVNDDRLWAAAEKRNADVQPCACCAGPAPAGEAQCKKCAVDEQSGPF